MAVMTAMLGAILVYLLFVRRRHSKVDRAPLKAELDQAGLSTVKRTPNDGQLDPEYVCKLLNFTSVAARKQRETEQAEELRQRREYCKNENWARYRRIVTEQMMKDDEMSNRVLGVVLQEVLPSGRDGAGGISKDELSRSMESMTKDAKMAKKLWLA